MIIIILCTNTVTGCTSVRENKGKDIGRSLFDIKTDTTSQVNEKTKSDDNIEILNYNDVKDSLIRFHVIANSDNDEDQKLKLKVKDKVIDYLYPFLSNSQSLDESRQIIKNNMDKVRAIAEQVIKENKYTYNVKTELSRENFPDKSYGNITLPQGNYEAFRIIIGSGQGRNWWCVMFPPLCFVDESKAQVEYNKTEDRIKASEKQSDLQSELNLEDSNLDKTSEDEKNNENKIEIKLKIVEMFKGLFK
jgi:stage II sporulation protein R